MSVVELVMSCDDFNNNEDNLYMFDILVLNTFPVIILFDFYDNLRKIGIMWAEQVSQCRLLKNTYYSRVGIWQGYG